MFQMTKSPPARAAGCGRAVIASPAGSVHTHQQLPSQTVASLFAHDFSRVPVFALGLRDDAQADTQCNQTTGEPYTKFHVNDPCTRECTEAHEATHRVDLAKTGACLRLHQAWQSAMASSDFIKTYTPFKEKHEAWMKENKSRFECNAYPVSVSCASRLFGNGNCSALSMTDKCCDHVRSYLKSSKAHQIEYCGKARDSFTPYPS
jgi:hypothetical protein